MADKLRLGIIGLGAQGGFYAGFLAAGRVPNTTLTAICDTDETKREVITSHMMPKMLVGGFTSVTFASVALANILAPYLAALFA